MKIVIHGYGQMGKIIEKMVNESSDELIGIVDFKTDKNNVYSKLENIKTPFDVIIDFSHYEQIDKLLNYLEKKPIKTVIATTNLNEKQLKKIKSLAIDNAIFQSYNTSYGIYAMTKLLTLASEMLGEDYDKALLDTHHRFKKDAPSGTTKLLAEYIADPNLQIASFRIGNVAGEHTITYANLYEEITISHKAYNKELFAFGALKAATELQTKETGLYDLINLYEEKK